MKVYDSAKRVEILVQLNLCSAWSVEIAELVFNGVRDGTHDSPKPVDNGYKLITSKNLKNKGIDFSNVNQISEADYLEIKKRSAVATNDILFSMIGTIGNVAIVGSFTDFAIKNVALFKNNEALILPKIAMYWLKSDIYQKHLQQNIKGGTQKFISLGSLRESPIPLIPLAEQQEIVRQLDLMLAQVEQIKARLDAIPAILKKFRQSVLADAVSGKLIVCKEKWKIVKLNDFVTSIEAGKNLSCIERPPVSDDEYGIVKISAVTWGKYNEEESKTLPEKSLFQESRRVKKGDLLLSRANTLELVGNPVIVHKTTKNLMLSDKVLRLVMSDHSKKWVNLFLKSKEGRNQIESRATGNQLSMRNISQKALMDIDIPQPSMDEQIQIGIQVDKFFEYAERIEQTIQSAQKRVNLLTQSILAKAFSGELTAEWREQHQDLITGVNSAEALLAKIQAEREASKPVKKTRAKKEA